MSQHNYFYSPLKCGVIWSGVVATALAVMIPVAVMTNHYNDTETERATACIEARGVYVNGVCSWSEDE